MSNAAGGKMKKREKFNKKLSRQIDLAHYAIDQLTGQSRAPGQVRKLIALRARLTYLEKQIWSTR